MLLSPPLFSQPFIWQNNFSEVSINQGVHYLPEHATEITLEQVSSSAYQKYFRIHASDEHLVLNDASAIWLYFDVINESDNEPYLLMDTMHFIGDRRVRVFLESQQEEYFRQLKPLNQSPLLAYKLGLQTGEKARLYLHIKKRNFHKTQLPIKVVSTDGLYDKNISQSVFVTGVFAGLLILLVYNLILFLTLRERNYLLLVGLLICMMLFMQRLMVPLPFLSLLKDEGFYFFSLPLSLFIASAIAFWKRIVDLQCAFPKANQFFNRLISFHIVSIPFLGLMTWGFETLFYLEAFLLLLLVPWYTTKGWLAGNQIARLFMLSIVIILLTISPLIFAALGVIETHSNIYKLYLLGSLLFALSLSLMQVFYVGKLRIEKEQVETLNKAKDMFLATTSHELRTPMHAIQAGISLLQQTLLSDKQKQYLGKMDISSKHMLRLVDDILMQSKLGQQAGNLLQPSPFSLDQLLCELEVLLTEMARQKRLSLTIDNDTQLENKQLIADKTRLKQVLSNLLSNAIKFTSEGSVGLSIKTQSVSDDQVTLYFEVSDSGIGFSEEQKTHLFEAFYQAEQGDNRAYMGTGLGLTISQHLVTLMGGNIECESIKHKGSRFFFTLNVEFADDVHDEGFHTIKAVDTDQYAKNESVLILMVEDDELNQFFAREIFKQIGMQLIVVDRGQKALDILKKEPFDLILMDISMPEMDGYETTRRIRKQEAFAHIPIIALSAHAADSDKVRCLQVGINDHLSKPFEIEQLKTILNKHLVLAKKT
jgi:signal transduction histidine kinase/CheY-like chemotaxis protein